MAACTACGANTELYFKNIPVCVRCSDARESKIEDRNQSHERANNFATEGSDATEPNGGIV